MSKASVRYADNSQELLHPAISQAGVGVKDWIIDHVAGQKTQET